VRNSVAAAPGRRARRLRCAPRHRARSPPPWSQPAMSRASAGSSKPARANQRSTRARTCCCTAARASGLSAAASAKWTRRSSPTANTPSITQQWKWTWAFNALPKRCYASSPPPAGRQGTGCVHAAALSMTRNRMCSTPLSVPGSRLAGSSAAAWVPRTPPGAAAAVGRPGPPDAPPPQPCAVRCRRDTARGPCKKTRSENRARTPHTGHGRSRGRECRTPVAAKLPLPVLRHALPIVVPLAGER
jgi:hypothetical protein